MYTELYEWLTFDIEALQEKWGCVVPSELTNALLDELNAFKYIADDFQAKFDAIDPQNTEEITRYNEAMRLIPQKLIYEAGLPTRPFFKNLVSIYPYIFILILLLYIHLNINVDGST